MKSIKTSIFYLNWNTNRFSVPKALLVYSCSLGIACFPLSALAENGTNPDSFPSTQQENRIIKGKIIDEKGETLIGVSILVKGTTIGTVTDFDGNFSLEVPKNGTLVISYVGYKSQEIKVSGRTDFAITLASDNKLLDEIVVSVTES